MNKTLFSIASLLAALVAFVALNLVSQRTLRSARADLTQSRLYTLSEGSRNIARSLKEPVRLTLYYSEQAGNDVAMFKPYAARVKEMLREYADAAGGKIDLKIVNPEPFSDAEDTAVQAGLAGVPTGRGNDRFYFGLVGRNSTDKQEIIPFFDPQKEEFLEYDLTHLIYLLSDAPKKAVGLMSWLPLEGQQSNPMFGNRGGQPPMQIYRQLQELFEVKNIQPNTVEIPKDIGVLLVVHPKKPSARTQFAIDQFVLRGGRLLLFVDPLCEADVPAGLNPMQTMNMPKDSDLNKVMAAWGLEMVSAKIAADMQSGLQVNAGSQNRPEPMTYVAWLGLGPARRSATDPVTGQLQQNINVATAGILNPKEGAITQITPLFSTSTDSMAVDATSFSFMPDPKKLLADFKPGDKSLMIGARITGKVKTAFPEGLPALEQGQTEADQPKPPTGPALTESADSINVIVIADCDMLTDRFWITEERLGPISMGFRKFADNGDLVIGALDNLSGSSDLMSLRARGRSARPFETVQKIKTNAEQKYLAKEQELQKNLRDTEQKISDLQRQKPDAKSKEALVLSDEQKKEIGRFKEQMVATRRELRDVQHQMAKDIERLGSRIKALNIGLMPVLVGLGALGLAAYRSARRRADRSSLGATN